MTAPVPDSGICGLWRTPCHSLRELWFLGSVCLEKKQSNQTVGLKQEQAEFQVQMSCRLLTWFLCDQQPGLQGKLEVTGKQIPCD